MVKSSITKVFVRETPQHEPPCFCPEPNLLGKRQQRPPEVEHNSRTLVEKLEFDVRFHQSNREYEIIDWIHEARHCLGTFNTFEQPVIEVHISDIYNREEFRHHSFFSSRADGVIAGFGTQGNQLALRRLAKLVD